MKCPYCGDVTKQKDWGFIQQKQKAVKLPPLTLYRCGKCAYLYTSPAIVDDNEPDGTEQPAIAQPSE